MLFPVLGKVNDVVDKQFHSFEALANSQHDGLERTRGSVLVASLSIPTVHLGCILR